MDVCLRTFLTKLCCLSPNSLTDSHFQRQKVLRKLELTSHIFPAVCYCCCCCCCCIKTFAIYSTAFDEVTRWRIFTRFKWATLLIKGMTHLLMAVCLVQLLLHSRIFRSDLVRISVIWKTSIDCFDLLGHELSIFNLHYWKMASFESCHYIEKYRFLNKRFPL